MIAKRYRKKTGRTKIFLTAFIVIVLMIVYVGLQMYIMTLEKRINEVRDRSRETGELAEECDIRVAELRKGSRIKKIATEKLGMKMPDGAPDTLY